MKKYTITKEQLFKAADDCADAACVKTLTKELERVKAERDEMQATFDLRWKADMRAAKAWQEATGKKLVWPDHADLCVWLMGELERVTAELRFWSGEHKHAGDCEFGEEGCYLCRNAEREHFLKITKPLLANADAELLTKEQVRPLVDALGPYTVCCDGCTCGDGWSHDAALAALAYARSLGF